MARPPPQDEDTPADPSLSTLRSLQSLSLLWEFSAEITDGRQVSGMTWNKGCRDMLAVGYGQFEFEKQRGGLIAFWSLKNPQFPEWTISTEQGVTALDFSAASPNLLAGGRRPRPRLCSRLLRRIHFHCLSNQQELNSDSN